MSMKTRVAKLEQASKPNRPEVFIYHPIVCPEKNDVAGPVVIGVAFRAGNELVHLDRGGGEKLDDLYARMRVVVTEKTGSKVAVGLDEKVREI